MTSPCGVTTMPVPAAGPLPVNVLMSTIPGSILPVTDASWADERFRWEFCGKRRWRPPPDAPLAFAEGVEFDGHRTCDSAAPPKAASTTVRMPAATSGRSCAPGSGDEAGAGVVSGAGGSIGSRGLKKEGSSGVLIVGLRCYRSVVVGAVDRLLQ